jgi:circadian clock protein KaiC
METQSDQALDARISTGVQELDNLLSGGLAPGHLYLMDGDSGTGKITLGIQFLMDGVPGESRSST